MLDWIKQRFAADPSPIYTAIKRTPNRDLPAVLIELEQSAQHQADLEVSQARWREAPLRPADDAPLATTIAAPAETAFITLSLPQGPCLPLFTSPFRAMDYAAVRLGQKANVPVVVSSAADLVAAAPGLTQSGVVSVAVDICPRCLVAVLVGVESLVSTDRIITLCSVALGTRDARRELYLRDAESRLGWEDRRYAREVALAIVAHVDAEDPRAHWLIGQIAIADRNRGEFREALRFLELLGLPGWCTRLEEGWTQGAAPLAYPPGLGRS